MKSKHIGWRDHEWLPVNWLIWKGLHNYGFIEEAQALSQNCLDLVAENGYREFLIRLPDREEIVLVWIALKIKVDQPL
jgi:hypothetical protein